MDIRDSHSQDTGPADESRSARCVTLSDRIQAYQDARRAALDVPDVRSDRVEALRRQAQNGDLVPDPLRIAEALLSQGLV